ncbi:50S ribosomal protein L4 [Fervidicoccus fontis]|uniref:Large ribosomal subunit protein uL4 n=1 Tax=Fervidicoccus fontis TaxID=683846 RepID=A0A2J6N323_9CREN|nr:50S ribosomal protein L4 [Fervidicoccus fontis]PMB75737.1 MAG: 50S ribosomal protein L4 [Fervidicoccus fontis]PMB78123.1 MAG: 50S ribosomal protein L4 [Fervidicoccus fontis]HEW64189.1 50S ribosomal protein L4 [Fervidicoccus fontis]
MVIVVNNSAKIEVDVFDKNAQPKEKTELPLVFYIPIRKDLIRRAFHAEFTAGLQPKGRDPMAGKRTPAESLGVGRGLARVPRVPGTSEGAFAPMTVGGRVAHPIKTEEKIVEEINKKERLLATASAVAATSSIEFVKKRGHKFTSTALPIVLDSSIEKEITKLSEAKELLKKLGVWEDVERSYSRIRIRSGKGKMRGRRYIEPKSLLFVLSSINTPFAKAVRNLPGVDVVSANNLSILHLAPGGVPGRLTIYTKDSLLKLQERFKNIRVVLR